MKYGDAKIVIPTATEHNFYEKAGDNTYFWSALHPGIIIGWIRLEITPSTQGLIVQKIRKQSMVFIISIFLIAATFILFIIRSAIRKTNFREESLLNNNAELLDIASIDTLTNLPNRLTLNEQLSNAIALSLEKKYPLAICFLDLDGFKNINDQYGHQAGDDLLIKVSQRLKAALRPDDLIFRIGGDEFVLILRSIQGEQDTDKVLQRLLKSLTKNFKLGDDVVHISASIGVALLEEGNADCDTLINHADQAMYSAKRNGKNQISFYDNSH